MMKNVPFNWSLYDLILLLLCMVMVFFAASTSAQIRHRITFEHPTDVPNNITIATNRQLGVDLNDGRLWRCEPTGTFCTSAAEWKPVGQIEIQEEGASLPLQPALNFIGTAVTCVDNPGSSRTDCTITGGGGGSFSDLTTGENTSATMSVGSGASLIHTGGVLGASKAYVLARKGSVGSISACSVVYVSGFNPGTEFVEVELADADASGKHPALGIVDTTVTNSAEGQVTVSGGMESRCDTSAFSVTDRIYLSTTPGQFSARPTADNEVVQPIGLVLRSHATQGRIAVVGAGNENDLPNLIAGTNVTSGADPGHAHTGASVTGFVLDTGDTMTGDLVMDDAAGDSPALSFVPAGATTWSLFTADTDGDFRLEANTASTEIFEIFNIGAGVADLDVEGDISGGNVTSGTDPGHTHSAAAAAWEALTNTADTATAFVGSADAETVTFDFQSAFAADRFSIKQTTGNPTAGTLFDLRAADADVVVFRAGDGTNGITVSQAGFIRSEGTGKINADCIDDDQDGNCEVLSSGDGGATVQEFSGVASAANFVKTTNAITAAGPTIAAEGETNVDLNLSAKGSGTINLQGGGDEILILATVASAVNEITITNAATGNSPSIRANGDDLNIGLEIDSKGTGAINLAAAVVVGGSIESITSGRWKVRNNDPTATAPNFLPHKSDQDTGMGRAAENQLSLIAGGVEALRLTTVASGVNRVEITPGATGVGSTIAAKGETNVNLNLTAKGTGNVAIDANLVIDNQQELRFKEGNAGGENYLAMRAPAGVTTNQVCEFEDDSHFIPDSCVGDGVDGSALIIEEDDVTVSGAATNLDFGAGFDLTESPAGETNIVIDYTEDPVNLSGAEVAGVLADASVDGSLEADELILAGEVTGAANANAVAASHSGSAHHTADGFGYDEVLDEASGLTKRAKLNFIGAGVSCVDNGASTRTDCTIGGGAITSLSDVTAKTGTGTIVVFSVGPALTGDPTVPTAAANDDDTSAASTAYVQQEINGAGGTGLSCATGTCNVDLGVSISATEIENDTIVAANVDASLDTRSTQIIFQNPDITQEFVMKLPPVTGTMTRIDCETVGATSMTIKVCDGEDVGDDTCTTNILDATETTTLVCTDSGASDLVLNAAGFVARDDVTVVITAVSGTPTQGIVYITSTVD